MNAQKEESVVSGSYLSFDEPGSQEEYHIRRPVRLLFFSGNDPEGSEDLSVYGPFDLPDDQSFPHPDGI